MKPLLAHKQTEEQKRSNDYARFQFIMAMMNLDFMMVRSLLKKDCKFLGNMNNWQLPHLLKSQFSKLNPHMFHFKFKEGVSLNYYPGSDIFEFSYAPMEDNSDNDPFFNEEQDEKAIFKSKMAFKIILDLLF